MASIIFPEGSRDQKHSYPKKQLLNHMVDRIASARPLALYAECPRSTTGYDAGFYKITYAALANAVNGMAWLLERELGQGKNHETVTYIGPRDFRHNVLVLAAVKAGYKMLLISPQNSIPGFTHLFEVTGCKIMLAAEPLLPVVDEILATHKLRAIRVPSVEVLLTTKYPHYPFEKTFDEAQDEPLVVLYTSGTTSLPKPTVYSNGFAACVNRFHQLNPPVGFKSMSRNYQSNRVFFMGPPFHVGSVSLTLINAIQNQIVIIFPPSGVAASAQVLVDGLENTSADVALLTPPMIAEIVRNPVHLDFVSRNLACIFYGGGDVSQKIGDVLMNKVKFSSINGSTEMGTYPLLEVDGSWSAEDWKYIIPHPDVGLEFRHQSENVYEAFIIRNSDDKLVQPVFKLHPELHEYPVGDWFSPHPSKSGLWKYCGRADDMIILLSGAKANPIVMEEHIASHPDVRDVLMAGTHRRYAGLLIERMTNSEPLSTTETAEFIDRLWATVQEANQLYETQCRISKSRIQFTDFQKPMVRAGKGTVQRKATLELYAEEMNALFAAADESDTAAATIDRQSPKEVQMT